ncbi:MAG: FecR domain-containing protein [Candidatus Pseudobacter hemicellulosilyticus]|uniref:FecR domain-containing protein n=1 Tax=Candidatus Pseudobacter hemicellulosilyticus TaxID=3121375 RepID=A0AAJ5WRP6_9BACT|nr:MAG: FecR domain-containing protein [Pseudobacter sp.]
MPAPNDIKQLIIRSLEGHLSPGDKATLEQWLRESPVNREAVSAFLEEGRLADAIREMYQSQDRVWSRLSPALEDQATGTASAATSPLAANRPVHRIHFLKTTLFRYAAAVLVLVAAGILFYTVRQDTAPGNSYTTKPAATAIAPGGDKATLTLADGSVIILDSAANGQLAVQEGAAIIKQADGRLQYVRNRQQPAAITYNTMRTPRGGQYQISLPDGTKVWLNAASSITYPTHFSSNERLVRITGEAFFEVAPQASAPFRVQYGNAAVEVLATAFNINAYEEEGASQTTLISGAVRVSSAGQPLLLKPGQQARLDQQGILSLLPDADTEAITAWKNGYFSFRKSDLPSVMRQLARWYDVTVEYRGNILPQQFGGEISRNAPLSEVLAILEASNIHFKIENKKIIVHP